MATLVEKNGISVDGVLVRFVEDKVLPGTGVAADAFWAGLSGAIHDLGPKNRALLAKRADLQAQIDAAVAKCAKGRSFVRASGTEDAVRVYAEAASTEEVEMLSEVVRSLVELLYGKACGD